MKHQFWRFSLRSRPSPRPRLPFTRKPSFCQTVGGMNILFASLILLSVLTAKTLRYRRFPPNCAEDWGTAKDENANRRECCIGGAGTPVSKALLRAGLCFFQFTHSGCATHGGTMPGESRSRAEAVVRARATICPVNPTSLIDIPGSSRGVAL